MLYETQQSQANAWYYAVMDVVDYVVRSSIGGYDGAVAVGMETL